MACPSPASLRSAPSPEVCIDRGDSGRVFGDMVDTFYRHFWPVGEGLGRRERLAITLAPVGPQAPPALRSARPVAAAALRAGPSYGLPGRAASVPTCPPCPRTPVHHLSGLYKVQERGCKAQVVQSR